jgi:nitroreductase
MKNSTNHPVMSIFSERWSPYAFDPNREIGRNDLMCLFEATRWTMSAKNTQPWRFIVGIKGAGDGLWEKLLDGFMPGNQAWAQYAPVLVVTLVQPTFDDGTPNKYAEYDLGAAAANLTNEATSRGIYVHQCGGIHPEKIKATFELDDTYQPMTGLVMGYAGATKLIDSMYAERQDKPRVRKPIEELILQGRI